MSLTSRKRKSAEFHCQRMYEALGVSFEHEDMKETPARFVRAMEELTSGMEDKKLPFKFTTFKGSGETSRNQLCTWPRIDFASMCSHHFLPFFGYVAVGYLPNEDNSVVGFSKIIRLVRFCAARPQMQEDFVDRVADQMEILLDKPRFVIVVARGVHTCAMLRGCKEHRPEFVTSAMRGVDASPSIRAEFMSYVDVKQAVI